MLVTLNILKYISFDKSIQEDVVLRSATDLGTIELSINTNSLDEVELVAERTEVEIRLDKRVYNVGKDITVRFRDSNADPRPPRD